MVHKISQWTFLLCVWEALDVFKIHPWFDSWLTIFVACHFFFLSPCLHSAYEDLRSKYIINKRKIKNSG